MPQKNTKIKCDGKVRHKYQTEINSIIKDTFGLGHMNEEQIESYIDALSVTSGNNVYEMLGANIEEALANGKSVEDQVREAKHEVKNHLNYQLN